MFNRYERTQRRGNQLFCWYDDPYWYCGIEGCEKIQSGKEKKSCERAGCRDMWASTIQKAGEIVFLKTEILSLPRQSKI